MKQRTKVIIAIIISLFAMTLMISHLFDKSEGHIAEEVVTTEDVVPLTQVSKTTTRKKTTKKVTRVVTTTRTNTYKVTHYGYDCKGCGGTTASGYNVRNTIYYNDTTYGRLRIVAIKGLPLYSIIKIKNYDGQDVLAIVLDKGVGYGVIDLLVENEKVANKLGIRRNVEIEIIRKGQ